MQIYIGWEVFESIIDAKEIQHLRRAFAKQVEQMLKSGKVSAHGIFADARAGFFIVNVKEAAEVAELLGGALMDHCFIETHPLISIEQLKTMFAREAKR